MEIINGIENIKGRFKNPVVTIGNFDGVHLAHKLIFEKVIERARAIDGESIVMTFEPHPIKLFQPTVILPLITSYEKKVHLIEKAGIGILIRVNFTREFANIPARDFVTEILCQKIDIKEIVVGYNCSFGKNRQGNATFLQEMAKDLDFKVHVMEPMKVNGIPVSSTKIREMIKDGQVKEVRRLLGRNYQIKGDVIKGRDRGGRLLGFPTANLKWTDELFPKVGVYAVLVKYKGVTYQGVANIGYSPTFGNKTLSIETHILDFNHDIYNEVIEIGFVDRLRDEKKFSNAQELTEQIKIDIQRARNLFKDVAGH
ncbi:MAG TPA: bifunctional riboflavin kinase/FAD synthetase [Syntrophaceae bacterium]|nr:bifunctional riboflavin kinase/FAD synthetase [Syntrophaceae bacterium]